VTDAKHKAGRLPAWLPKTRVDRLALTGLAALGCLLVGVVVERGI
jgi:hypothetical protein